MSKIIVELTEGNLSDLVDVIEEFRNNSHIDHDEYRPTMLDDVTILGQQLMDLLRVAQDIRSGQRYMAVDQ